MTTPTERGFVTTYTHCILQLKKKDELKLIQEEEERSMGSKLALKLKWAIQLPNVNLVPGRNLVCLQ
jgi:hypothetical protein